jgi:polysaccharide deacetylase family protein (PEP-CTERM system associated)
MTRHALTIDLEDWQQLMTRRLTGRSVPPSDEVLRLTDEILGFLDRRRVRATFFVVGMLAEARPDLVRGIAAAGHEVATHGYAHLRVDGLTPDAFRSELRRSVAILGELSGQTVLGHRAPEFSISRANLWALDVLVEEGFAYDSSIFPIRSRRYGIPDFSRRPCRIATAAGSLVEFPLATLEVASWRVPAAGGGYLRLWPYAVTHAVLRRHERDATPAVIYLHPYDLPGERLRLADPAPRWKTWYWMLRHNIGRTAVMGRLDRLVDEFSFGPLREAVDGV